MKNEPKRKYVGCIVKRVCPKCGIPFIAPAGYKLCDQCVKRRKDDSWNLSEYLRGKL